LSRNVSAVAQQAVFAQETGEVFLILLEILHADLPAPIRVVNNSVSIVSGGDTYLPFPFEIDLPSDTDDVITTARLTISNVDRQIVSAVRSITTSPIATITIVLASSPDTVEVGPYEFTLSDVTYDADKVTGTLTFDDALDLRIPADRFRPSLFPGLF